MTPIAAALTAYLIIGCIIGALMYAGIALAEKDRRDPDTDPEVRRATAGMHHALGDLTPLAVCSLTALVWPYSVWWTIRAVRRDRRNGGGR